MTDDVVRIVIGDMEARRTQGFQRYGQFLHPNNGRDAMWDAYEEALDLAFYLRQMLLERADSVSIPLPFPQEER